MPELISKLQYKEYETGEFIDEKPRSLEEVRALIKSYPWETERHLAEVQPTCPSVTIVNEFNEYLKVGPYFNNKFCIYFLDTSEHLYELHVLNLDAACAVVDSFFDGSLDISRFEKHMFSTGFSKHFITQSFEYGFNYSRFWFSVLISAFLIFISIVLIFAAFMTHVYPPLVFGFLFLLLSGWLLFTCINHYNNYRDQYLNIKQGSNIFYYGPEQQMKMYKKSDIVKIKMSGRYFGDRRQNLSTYKIEFKDGSLLDISGFIISNTTLHGKFNGIPFA